jgi:cyanophycinase
MKRQVFGRMFLLPACVLLVAVTVRAEQKPAARLRPAGIEGSLVICGGGKVPDAVRDRFVQLAGGEKAKLVILRDIGSEENAESWQVRKPASVDVMDRPPRKLANEDRFLKPLRQATGVWLEGGYYPGPSLEQELRSLLKRGGVLGGRAALSQWVLFDKDTRMEPGLDLLPRSVIVPHFQDDRQQQLLAFLDKNPGLVGLGISEGTALVIKGRQMRVLGEGTVSVCLAACPTRPARTVKLKANTESDFTMWRRAALARVGPAYPPAKAPLPEVPHGTLVIVGGGGVPAPVLRKFIELAGGPDAPLVVLPTAQPDPIPTRYGEVVMLERAGAKNVRLLPGRELKDVEDPQNLDVLKKAKGVWFGGGRQWRFLDAYEGTKAEPLIRDVLRRGGVIGGSSAGASIQADYLARGSPLGNTEMMCEGYERGLGFLPGVAVDQHFARRNRFADMAALVKTYPQLLGIGIDESTALIVHGHMGTVLGRGKVYFYDRNKPIPEGGPDYEAVPAGGRYDLKARKGLPAEGAQEKNGSAKPGSIPTTSDAGTPVRLLLPVDRRSW